MVNAGRCGQGVRSQPSGVLSPSAGSRREGAARRGAESGTERARGRGAPMTGSISRLDSRTDPTEALDRDALANSPGSRRSLMGSQWVRLSQTIDTRQGSPSKSPQFSASRRASLRPAKTPRIRLPKLNTQVRLRSDWWTKRRGTSRPNSPESTRRADPRASARASAQAQRGEHAFAIRSRQTGCLTWPRPKSMRLPTQRVRPRLIAYLRLSR
jgi:hypothetical protein